MMDEENRMTENDSPAVTNTNSGEAAGGKAESTGASAAAAGTPSQASPAGSAYGNNSGYNASTPQAGSGDGRYTWQPYQAQQNAGANQETVPNGTYISNYSAAPYTGYQGVPQQAPKKKGVSKGLVIGLCGFFGLVLVFASAWIASTIAYMGMDAAAKAEAEKNKETVILAENPNTSRTDGAELQNSSYENLADLVEDVTHSLVTIYNGSEYSDGVIVGEDSSSIYVACAYTVVSTSRNSLQVIYGKDSKTVTPEVQGTYMDSDLAVIKLQKSSLDEAELKEMKIAVFGKSEGLQLGDLAIAFGSPMGYYNTPSLGAISGLERTVTVTLNNTALSLEMIQTDAAINTSGVLFNGKGEVIGLTVKISIEDSEGIGFAVPAEKVMEVVEELIEKGYVTTPYMGFTGYDVMNFYPNGSSESWAEHYHLPAGVLVASVVEGSPAEEAGLAPYDLIIGFNDQTIEDFDDLRNWLDECEVGQTVTVEVVRGYTDENAEPTTEILTLTIGQKPQ